MARLILARSGVQKLELELKPGQEYMAGRGDDCQIELEGERGISRHHFKLSYLQGAWQVEVLSRYGELYLNGVKTKQFKLEHGSKFSVPPYDFTYSDEVAQQADLHATNIIPLHPDLPEASEDEKTFVGAIPLQAYLKLIAPDGEMHGEHRLAGDDWIVGRDTSCNVFIDHPKISRRQFEILRQGEDYMIRDLGSANGTVVNGSPISPDQWTPIRSGDVIALADWTLQFELRDANFEQRVSVNLPAITQNYTPAHRGTAPSPTFTPSPQSFTYNHPYLSRVDWKSRLKGKNAIYALVALLLVGYLVYDSARDSSKNQTVAKPGLSPFDRLTPEKQLQVKQLFASGFELFKSQNYELARSRMIEIHQIIPSGFENSIEIQTLAEQSLAIHQENERIRIEEEKKRQIQQMVLDTTLRCRDQMNRTMSTVTHAEIEGCLHEAIAADPMNPDIQKLLSEVDNHVVSRRLQAESQARYKEEMSEQLKRYNRAESLAKRQKYLDALKVYRSVLSSDLPNPNNVKGLAQRNIASIQDKIDEVTKRAQAQANSAAKSGNFKDAILILKAALPNDPDSQEIKAQIRSSMNQLSKQMQRIFEEAHFEESYGEIESAQNKWRKIMEMSLPEEEYYGKAKTRLGRYGRF